MLELEVNNKEFNSLHFNHPPQVCSIFFNFFILLKLFSFYTSAYVSYKLTPIPKEQKFFLVLFTSVNQLVVLMDDFSTEIANKT